MQGLRQSAWHMDRCIWYLVAEKGKQPDVTMIDSHCTSRCMVDAKVSNCRGLTRHVVALLMPVSHLPMVLLSW